MKKRKAMTNGTEPTRQAYDYIQLDDFHESISSRLLHVHHLGFMLRAVHSRSLISFKTLVVHGHPY